MVPAPKSKWLCKWACKILLKSHDLANWLFDADGYLVIPDNEHNLEASLQGQERKSMTVFASELANLQILKKSY